MKHTPTRWAASGRRPYWQGAGAFLAVGALILLPLCPVRADDQEPGLMKQVAQLATAIAALRSVTQQQQAMLPAQAAQLAALQTELTERNAIRSVRYASLQPGSVGSRGPVSASAARGSRGAPAGREKPKTEERIEFIAP